MSESVEQAALLAGIATSLGRIMEADAATRGLFEEIRRAHEEWLEQLTARVDSLTTIVAGREICLCGTRNRLRDTACRNCGAHKP